MKKPGRPRILRILFYLVAGLAALCLLGAGVLWVSNANLPTASADPSVLTGEQAALVAEALHLRTNLGEALWPGFGADAIPVLVFSESHAFMCGLEGLSERWEPIAAEGMACARSTWQNGQNFAVEVEGRWAASMATREWGLVLLRQELGEQMPPVVRELLGPLLVNEMLTPHRYLGGILHESFHAFQANTARTVFEDAEAAYADGPSYWAIDPQMNAAWAQEINALLSAVEAQDDEEARTHAGRFLHARRQRREQYFTGRPQLARYEQRFEWLEGLAKYAELGMLRLACDHRQYQSLPAMQQVKGFRGYCAINNLWKQELQQMQRQAGQEGDTRFYYTGWAQALMLDRFLPGWKPRVLEGALLEELLAEVVGDY